MHSCISVFLISLYTGKDLKAHRHRLATEIGRARVAVSGPLRRKFININFLSYLY